MIIPILIQAMVSGKTGLGADGRYRGRNFGITTGGEFALSDKKGVCSASAKHLPGLQCGL